MANIIKSIFWFFIIVPSIFSIISMFVLFRYKKIRTDYKTPQPYRGIYNKLRETPFFGSAIEKYRQDLFLINGSRSYAETYVSVCSVILCCAVIVVVMLVGLYVKTWYFALMVIMVAIPIPYLLFTNSIIFKARNMRINCISIYESAERYLSSGMPTVDIFANIAESSKGSLNRLLMNFLNLYYSEPADAYEYFCEAVGDKFALDFITCIREYDEYGVEVHNRVKKAYTLARRDYYLKQVACRGFKDFKFLTGLVLVIVLVMSYVSESASASVSETVVGPILPELSYMALFLVILAVLCTLLYERM